MKIRNRLTYLFIALVAVVILSLSVSIYYFSAQFREDDFYQRLETKASSTAKLLVDVDEIDAALLQIIEKSTPENLPNERIVIIDYQNEVLFSTDEDQSLVITPTIIDEIRLNEIVKYRQGKYEILGMLFVGKYDRFVVISAATDTYGLRKLQNLRLILLIGILASIVLVTYLGWIYSGKAMSPILSVIKQVENITESSLNLRLEEGNGKDEIAQLSKTFNDMLNRLEIAFKAQKNFIANASHELRTPLTVITGQLDVVLMKERTPDEYKKTLESVLEDIRQLNRISNRLLLLAQTSADLLDINFRHLRIDDIVWQARSEVLKRVPHYRVLVEFDGSIADEKSLTVNANDDLIKTALINLMDNACKYADPPEVYVRLTLQLPNHIAILFVDHGLGITPADALHIFEPFYRSPNVISIKGHGIGLSLVDRIVKLHRGQISFQSEPGKGSTFTLLLPLAASF